MDVRSSSALAVIQEWNSINTRRWWVGVKETYRSNPNIWTPVMIEMKGRKGTTEYTDVLLEGSRRLWQSRARWGPYEQRTTSVNLKRHRKNHHHCTCFQRMRSKPNTSLAPKRRRSKPMSMMTSNTTSAISEPIILGFMLAGLSSTQVFCSFDHETRTCG